MREIKFRAWDDKVKLMSNAFRLTTQHITFNDSRSYLSMQNGAGYWQIMQYTGLKDKNGVDIYEGDILKTEYGANYAVKWLDEIYYDGGGGAHSGFYFCSELDWNLDLDRSLIVGNIYENPDLLEKSQ